MLDLYERVEIKFSLGNGLKPMVFRPSLKKKLVYDTWT